MGSHQRQESGARKILAHLAGPGCRRVCLILVLLLAWPSTWVMAEAKLKKKEKDDYGTTYWGEFEHAPFPAKGFKYNDKTIAVFVPAHFCPVLMRVKDKKGGKRRVRYQCYSRSRWKRYKKKGAHLKKVTEVDYVIHFHGHSNTVEKALNNHRLREQFSLSLQNAILIVPQGPVNAIDSAAGKLESSGGFKRMLREVHRFLRSQGVINEGQYVRRLIITSHSGGYRAAANCLKHGGYEVSEVYLFDSLYAHTDVFFEWLKKAKKKQRRFVNLYYRDKPRKRSKELMAMLKKAGIHYARFNEEDMKKEDFARKELVHEDILFINTELGHSGCTRGNFNYRDYLFASGLRRVVPTDWFEKSGLDKLKLP